MVLSWSQADLEAGPLAAASQPASPATAVAALGVRCPICKMGKLIPAPRVVGKACDKVHVKALCKQKEGSGFSCRGSRLRSQRSFRLRSNLDFLILLKGVNPAVAWRLALLGIRRWKRLGLCLEGALMGDQHAVQRSKSRLRGAKKR